MYNNLGIMGRLVNDPEYRTAGDSKVFHFRIACDRNYKNKDGEYISDFFDVTAWNKAGEHIGKFFTKGDLILLLGSIETESWTDKEDKKRTRTYINANWGYFCERKKDITDPVDQAPASFGAAPAGGQFGAPPLGQTGGQFGAPGGFPVMQGANMAPQPNTFPQQQAGNPAMMQQAPANTFQSQNNVQQTGPSTTVPQGFPKL